MFDANIAGGSGNTRGERTSLTGTPVCAYALTIWAVRSVEPASTTIISWGARVCFSRESSSGRMLDSSFQAGMTTDTE